MKYIKTYEQIKNFYQSSPKYLVVTTDKKWFYNPNDHFETERVITPVESIDDEDIMDWTFPTHDNMMGYINGFQTSVRTGNGSVTVIAADYLKYPGLIVDLTDDEKLNIIDMNNRDNFHINNKPKFGKPTEWFHPMNDVTKNLMKANPEHLDSIYNSILNNPKLNRNMFLKVKNPGMKQIEMLVGLYRNTENPNI